MSSTHEGRVAQANLYQERQQKRGRGRPRKNPLNAGGPPSNSQVSLSQSVAGRKFKSVGSKVVEIVKSDSGNQYSTYIGTVAKYGHLVNS